MMEKCNVMGILLTDASTELTEEIHIGERLLRVVLPQSLLDLVIRVVLCFLFFLIGIKVIRLVRRIAQNALKRTNISDDVRQFLDSAIKAGLYLILVLQIAIRLGLDATSIATLLGSAAVTVGLAFQGSLKNCIGGVLILILHPFRVGDYIVESTYNHEGTVVEITVFYTKLATVDNKIIMIPNGGLADTSIINVTNEEFRRLELKVGIAYSADIRSAKAILEELAQSDGRICKDRDMAVYVDELGSSSVVLGMKVWTATADFWAVKWSMLEKIKYAFDENEIGIPFPQMDVHLDTKG